MDENVLNKLVEARAEEMIVEKYVEATESTANALRDLLIELKGVGAPEELMSHFKKHLKKEVEDLGKADVELLKLNQKVEELTEQLK